MAPSPELGQPKAPDKVTAESRTMSNTMSSTSTTVPDVSITGVAADYGAHNNQRDQPKSSSSSVAIQPDAENVGNMDEGELKKLLDEAITYKRPKDREHKSQIFKKLLQHVEIEDQARDCFSNQVFSRPSRGSNPQGGGSLQDLFETVQNEHILDGDFTLGGQNRRHHHNSRQKKYSSSVSSRQREGGSLPSNVNVSHCNLYPYDESLLNEFNRRKTKNDKTILLSAGVGGGGGVVGGVGGAGSTQMHDGILRNASIVGSYDATQGMLSNDGKISHTVIEIGDNDADETRHLLAHDSLAQGIPDPLSGDEGTELNPMKKMPRVSMNYTTQVLNVDVSVGESTRSSHSIDKTVQFSSMLKSSNKPLDVSTVQLNNSYVAVNSCMDSKSGSSLTLNSSSGSGPNGKFATYSHGIQKHLDENGNSLQSFATSMPPNSQPNKLKKNNKNKADRNTKTLNAEEIKGHRGHDNIDTLLAFIENKETTKRNGVINVNKNVLNASDKGKNKQKSSKRENGGGGGNGNGNNNNKLKKSNSLEELKSSSKIEEEIAQSECGGVQGNNVVVTMRQKQQQQQLKKCYELKENHSSSSNSSATNSITNSSGSQNSKQQSSKRGERRSWGTEEFSYLDDTSCIAKENDDLNRIDKDNRKTNKENIAKQQQQPIPQQQQQQQHKKKEEHSLSIVSIESISTSNETAEFHVVTKKRKAKKRQTLDDARQKQQNIVGASRTNNTTDQSSSSIHTNRGRYQPSHNYTNDRDVYLTSFNATDNNRRKSTSSVPPSEKSDSSDLDSVHSLPIESSTRLTINQQQQSQQQQQQQQISSTLNSGGIPQASWADIARKTNSVDKTTTTTMTSPPTSATLSTPTDKWPIVSNNNNNNSNSKCFDILSDSPFGNTNINNNNYKIHSNARTALKFNSDFNEMPINNEQTHDAMSSCSSTSSNSTIVKQISYSQSLSDEKSPSSTIVHHNCDESKRTIGLTVNSNNISSSSSSSCGGDVSPKTATAAAATPATNITTMIIVDHNAKNPLQKSKSVDNDSSGYVNMTHENYPALQKTVKPQKQYQSLPAVEIPKTGKPTTKTAIYNTVSTVNPTIGSNTQPSTTAGIAGATAVTSTATKKTKQNVNTMNNHQSQSKDSSNTIKSFSQYELPMQSETNVCRDYEHQTMNKLPQTIDNINNNKTKFDEHHHTTTKTTTTTQHMVSSGNVGHKKSNRKDKSSLHHSNANRPAVIILNDNCRSSSHMDSVSPLLFGDFNEEDLRLLETEPCHSNPFNRTQTMDPNNSSSTASQTQDDSAIDSNGSMSSAVSTGLGDGGINILTTSKETLTSPQSDFGYSSLTYNRNVLSTESLDTISAGADGAAAAVASTTLNAINNITNNTYQQQQQQQQQQQNFVSTTSTMTVAIATTPPSSSSPPSTSSLLSPSVSVSHQSASSSSILPSTTSSVQHFVPIENIGLVASNKSKYINNKCTTITGGGGGGGGGGGDNSGVGASKQQQQQQQQIHATNCNEPNNNNATLNSNSNNNINNSNNNNNNSSSNSNAINRNHMEKDEIFNQTAVTAPNCWDRNTTSELKELSVRYIAPAVTPNLNSYNHDKIVNFVGMAWENVICGVNGGAKFYNGQ